MFNFFKKTDSDIKKDVLSELMWDPSLDASKVKIAAADGIITLSGTVPHYFEKRAAESAAQRVGGVKGVADELQVMGVFDKTDTEIAAAAVNALRWNYSVPDDIKVSVDKGWLTLRGEVDWDYQRTSAKNTCSDLLGVVGVSNEISLRVVAQSTDIKTLIEDALKRSAESEGRKITVKVHGDRVVLTGHVHSFSEIEDARMAAYNAPGVMSVDNQLIIAQ